MDRVRQGWRYLQLKWYGPPRPPFTVPTPWPHPLTQRAVIPRKRGPSWKERQKSSEGSRSPVQKKARKPKLCRNINEYATRLENLVSGIRRLEDAEQEKRSIAEQIIEQAANEDDEEDSSDAEPIDDLLTQQDIANRTIKDELNELSTNADRILDSLDEQGYRYPLPTGLIAQLRRYGDARVAFADRRISISDEKDESDLLRKIEAALYCAANRTHNRGWIPTQSRLRRMRNRKADILKRRRVLEIGKESMTSELRRLCKGEAAATLEMPAFRPESERIRLLKRRARKDARKK